MENDQMIYLTRSEAFDALRQEFPDDLQAVFCDSDSRMLIEAMFEGIVSESLFTKFEGKPDPLAGNPGYSAYLPKYGIILNEKKAAIYIAALIVDILLTSGFVSLALTQVVNNPRFVRRLTSKQHLACIMNQKEWASLAFDKFSSTLKDSQCKNPKLHCVFRDSTGECKMRQLEYDQGKLELSEFFNHA